MIKLHSINKGFSLLFFRIGPSCLATGLLELWSFNETVINQLTKEDILEKINQKPLIRYILTTNINAKQCSNEISCNH